MFRSPDEMERRQEAAERNIRLFKRKMRVIKWLLLILAAWGLSRCSYYDGEFHGIKDCHSKRSP